MGCCEQPGKNDLVNNLFLSLPIRKLTVSDFFKEYPKEILSENDFQEIINKYLLPNTSDDTLVFNYWFDFYHDINFKERCTYVKFALSCLCKEETEEEMRMIATMLIDYNKILIKESDPNSIEISKNELMKIVSRYVLLVTYFIITNFKYMWYDSEKFEQEAQLDWDKYEIDSFVRDTYFSTFIQERRVVDVNKFLGLNLTKLKNDCAIREQLREYTSKKRILNITDNISN